MPKPSARLLTTLMTLLACMGCNLSDPAAPISRAPQSEPQQATDMATPLDMRALDMRTQPGPDMSAPDMRPLAQDMSPDLSGVDMTCVPLTPEESCKAEPGCGTRSLSNGCGARRPVECMCAGACVEGVCAELTLAGSNAGEGDLFGAALLLRGDTLFVGAPGHGSGSGAVYVFKRAGSPATWKETQILKAAQVQQGAQFGHALALEEGGALFVGMPGFDIDTTTEIRDPHQGGVEVFSPNPSGDFMHVRSISSPEPRSQGAFGTALASPSAGDVFIGEPSVTQGGRVYRFEMTGEDEWKSVEQLIPTPAVTTQRFGHSLAVSQDRLAVGAPAPQDQSGVVHVFAKSATPPTWSHERSFNSTYSSYGINVGMLPERLFVATGSGNSQECLQLFVIQGDEWKHAGLLDCPLSEKDEELSLAFQADKYFVAGSPRNNGAQGLITYYEPVDIFRWKATKEELAPAPRAPGERFGASVAIEGDTMMVGAPGRGSNGAGEVIVMEFNPQAP